MNLVLEQKQGTKKKTKPTTQTSQANQKTTTNHKNQHHKPKTNQHQTSEPEKTGSSRHKLKVKRPHTLSLSTARSRHLFWRAPSSYSASMDKQRVIQQKQMRIPCSKSVANALEMPSYSSAARMQKLTLTICLHDATTESSMARNTERGPGEHLSAPHQANDQKKCQRDTKNQKLVPIARIMVQFERIAL